MVGARFVHESVSSNAGCITRTAIATMSGGLMPSKIQKKAVLPVPFDAINHCCCVIGAWLLALNFLFSGLSMKAFAAFPGCTG